MSKETPNLEYIKKLSGDDLAFEQKFIAILKDEFPVEKQEYIKTLREGKTNESALIVHKLKHKLNILGLEKAYGLAVTYEEELKMENTALNEEFSSILETIESYLKTL
ncbi:MAG: Hpt domain-containing protein [Eudoraea sp.]|nr:Hpt domain-containing protein [Eudoraea sp.]MBT8291679.1 Hpt domain-containing protein [Eudoraea sp.]NNE03431.1 Hpt domain-containing protein [Eudoraea sp.]NNL00907.1 Hpt domain-containing protein [Eudoraea sp.]